MSCQNLILAKDAMEFNIANVAPRCRRRQSSLAEYKSSNPPPDEVQRRPACARPWTAARLADCEENPRDARMRLRWYSLKASPFHPPPNPSRGKDPLSPLDLFGGGSK